MSCCTSVTVSRVSMIEIGCRHGLWQLGVDFPACLTDLGTRVDGGIRAACPPQALPLGVTALSTLMSCVF